MVREYLHSSRTRVSAPRQPPFSDNLSSPNESNTCWNFGGSFSVLEDTRPRFLVIVRLLEEAFMEVGKNNHDGLHAIDAQANTISAQQVVKAAHEELLQLMWQRAEVMKRIGTVKQTIAGLANLFGDQVLGDDLLELLDRKPDGRQPRFTKACRRGVMAVRPPCGA